MLPYHFGFRHAVSWLVAGILALQSLAAADAWSRVARLKAENDWVYISLSDGKYLDGRFLGADISGMTVRTIAQGEVTLARDLVSKIAISQNRRRWYTIPITVVAAGAGAFVGYIICHHIENFKPLGPLRQSCCKVALVGIAAVPAAAAYHLTLGPDKKVIYDKASASTRRRK